MGAWALGDRAMDKGTVIEGMRGGHSIRSKLRGEPPWGRGVGEVRMERLGQLLTRFTLPLAERLLILSQASGITGIRTVSPLGGKEFEKEGIGLKMPT